MISADAAGELFSGVSTRSMCADVFLPKTTPRFIAITRRQPLEANHERTSHLSRIPRHLLEFQARALVPGQARGPASPRAHDRRRAAAHKLAKTPDRYQRGA